MSAVAPMPDSQKLLHAIDVAARLPVVSTVVWLASIVLALLLPFRYAFVPSKNTDPVVSPKEARLFPSIEKAVLTSDFSAGSSVDEPQPCSTGLTTRLLPFKNDKGEIEWALTDDFQPGSELDAFKVNMGSKPGDILSPVTSNSSNSDSLVLKKEDANTISPQMDTPSSTASDDEKKDDDDNQVHQCPLCSSRFKMRGYLTRHLKKHSTQKAYTCPFHKSSIYKDENDITHKCHPSGGFSRRDTYKTHLKSRHFKYPKGVHIKDRNLTPGNCSMCGEWFQNAEIWSEIHIEGAECKYLPQGFKGKSRIKNRLKKQMARMMKEQKKQMRCSANGPSEYQSPNPGTPNSVNTPMPLASGYDYNNSPTLSVSSSVGQHSIPHQPLHETVHRMMFTPALAPPTNQELKSTDDYDDDFCLDTEQMCLPIEMMQHSVLPHAPPGMFHPGAYPTAGHNPYSH